MKRKTQFGKSEKKAQGRGCLHCSKRNAVTIACGLATAASLPGGDGVSQPRLRGTVMAAKKMQPNKNFSQPAESSFVSIELSIAASAADAKAKAKNKCIASFGEELAKAEAKKKSREQSFPESQWNAVCAENADFVTLVLSGAAEADGTPPGTDLTKVEAAMPKMLGKVMTLVDGMATKCYGKFVSAEGIFTDDEVRKAGCDKLAGEIWKTCGEKTTPKYSAEHLGDNCDADIDEKIAAAKTAASGLLTKCQQDFAAAKTEIADDTINSFEPEAKCKAGFLEIWKEWLYPTKEEPNKKTLKKHILGVLGPPVCKGVYQTLVSAAEQSKKDALLNDEKKNEECTKMVSSDAVQNDPFSKTKGKLEEAIRALIDSTTAPDPGLNLPDLCKKAMEKLVEAETNTEKKTEMKGKFDVETQCKAGTKFVNDIKTALPTEPAPSAEAVTDKFKTAITAVINGSSGGDAVKDCTDLFKESVKNLKDGTKKKEYTDEKKQKEECDKLAKDLKTKLEESGADKKKLFQGKIDELLKEVEVPAPGSAETPGSSCR